ncbi:MAG: hypothetical protein KAR47_07300 [Planctomycetes bacterium]|nr:hypothetical protein [Planctomycetota bacterium]
MKYKVDVHCNWQLEVDLELDKWVNVYVDCVPEALCLDGVTVLMLVEPDEIYHLTGFAIENHRHFDYILTHDTQVLENCPNAVLFEFGTCWVWSDYQIKEKLFGVSTVVGNKKKMAGHLIRQQLRDAQKQITIPSQFFISSRGGPDDTGDNPTLGERKDAAFDMQFHIAIENIKRDFWFTEKLIDCFVAGAVPIYWGCPGIGKYFNLDGMILVDDCDQIIRAVNSLTPDTYESMKKAMEDNRQRAEGFRVLSDRLRDKLKELLCVPA